MYQTDGQINIKIRRHFKPKYANRHYCSHHSYPTLMFASSAISMQLSDWRRLPAYRLFSLIIKGTGHRGTSKTANFQKCDIVPLLIVSLFIILISISKVRPKWFWFFVYIAILTTFRYQFQLTFKSLIIDLGPNMMTT